MSESSPDDKIVIIVRHTASGIEEHWSGGDEVTELRREPTAEEESVETWTLAFGLEASNKAQAERWLNLGSILFDMIARLNEQRRAKEPSGGETIEPVLE